MTTDTLVMPETATGVADTAARAISILSDHGFAVAVLVAIDTHRRRRSPIHAALRLAAVGIPIVVVNATLKRAINRPRPATAAAATGLVRRPTSSSFPSGHTLAAATAAVALPTTLPGQVGALAGATVVGWSRVRLGAHHASDVAGGLAIGTFLGALLRLVVRVLDGEFRTRQGG